MNKWKTKLGLPQLHKFSRDNLFSRMRSNIQPNLDISFLVTSSLFILFFLLFNPCYNSNDDIYFLYTVSGGYGNDPSGLLHWSYMWHPLLSSTVASLFRYFPGFNWYSFFLVLFHFISCTILLFSFLHYFRKWYAIGAFLIFFLFIESRLLLRFNFSEASLIGVMSGSISLLLHYIKNKEGMKISRKRLFFFLLLVFVGGLIRIHYMALFGLFAAWMGLFFLTSSNFINFLKNQLMVGLFLVLSFMGQRYYFQEKIPGWKDENKMAKVLIYISHHPRKKNLIKYTGIEKLKQDLMSIRFLYDNKLTDYNAFKKFGRENTRGFKLIPESFSSFYWLFMDLRLYLFLFVGMIIFFIMNKNRKFLFRFICMSLFYIITFIILRFYFRYTEVIFLTVVASILLSGFLCLDKVSPTRLSVKIACFLALLSCIWMIIRLDRMNDQNKKRILHARGVIKELYKHDNILFVEVENSFDFSLSLWDVPKKYPIHNLVYYELFFTNSYKSQLARYGITNLMKEIPVKDNIYLVGQKASILIEYYRLLYNRTVRMEKVPGFEYIEAYRILPVNNK